MVTEKSEVVNIFIIICAAIQGCQTGDCYETKNYDSFIN